MKTLRPTLAAITSVAFLALFSCETQDPSAIGEIQRDLAEALANNIRLEDEVASLTEQLEHARNQPAAEPQNLEIPTREEIEKSMVIEATKLQQTARELHPNSEVKGLSTFDLKIPSFDTPFSCKAEIVLREPSGKIEKLYWIGNANMKGEWTFEKTGNLKPDTLANNQDNSQASDKSNHDIPLIDPIMKPKNSTADAPNVQRAPEQPKKPDVKYDIPLDNPVMKPGR